jgi:predicted ferric reductase
MLGREYILGIKGKTLMTVHQWAGIIFFILMVIHIIIHLKWLTNPPKIKAGKSE